MRPSRPSMACLMAAPVTASVLVDIASSLGSSRPRLRAGLVIATDLLRPAGSLRFLGGQAQDRIGIPLEAAEVDLHAVEHRAPMPHDRRHGDRLLDIFIRRTVRLGGGGVEVGAIL